MGWDYALVHITYTIPPALILTAALKPFLTRTELYKICFLISIAVLYTIPWDSYLIYRSIWTYPEHSVLGVTVFRIPVEELFFFIIQTYLTSLIYILLNKPTVFPIHLRDDSEESVWDVRSLKFRRLLGQVALITGIIGSIISVLHGGKGTYFGLIGWWALPVLLLLWTLSYQLILGLPWSKTLLPIALPTLYLWVVDTLSLHRGTWTITTGTKLSIFLWPNLEIEEASFFLITNTLVVWGLCAFDNALAILDTSDHFQGYSSIHIPPPQVLLKVLLTSTSTYDVALINGLSDALCTLQSKSRSFYLASSTFSGPLRIDLIILYAYCRVADDLIDNAASEKEARIWIARLRNYLAFAYSSSRAPDKGRVNGRSASYTDVLTPFPENSRSILLLLPVYRLPPKPLDDLLAGFETDLEFAETSDSFPISNFEDLQLYGHRVASTVAELCLHLAYYHHGPRVDTMARQTKEEFLSVKEHCLAAGKRMGQILQYINIVRDVTIDAKIGRCYLPSTWLAEHELTPQKVVSSYGAAEGVLRVREKLLNLALELYQENVRAIEDLPRDARDGIKVAVESYVEIGRVISGKFQEGNATAVVDQLKLEIQHGRKRRATVPRLRRLWVAWKAMGGLRGNM